MACRFLQSNRLLLTSSRGLLDSTSLSTPLHASRAVSTCPALLNKKMNRRDQNRRRCVAEYADRRLYLKAIVKNKLLPEVIQERARKELAAQPRDASVTRVRNRCVLTGRGRGVVTEYGLVRMKFRHLADHGLLSGITRSSW